jgi:hypothetical protein
MSPDEQLRYPVGRFTPKDLYTKEGISSAISNIEELPQQLDALVKSFSEKQWDTTYRQGGWTARQVVHHLADSHMNAYIRFKWTLTEQTPTIKAYDEKAWAETPETKADPIISINFLKALHVKWVTLLKLLTTEDLQRQFMHPETKKLVAVDRLIATYGWHGEHHLGHLKIIAGKN